MGSNSYLHNRSILQEQAILNSISYSKGACNP